MDARKRTVSSSVRSGTGLSGAVQSGLLVRPTSASGLHEAMRRPHCSSTTSNNSDERSANGPRRVPLPEVKHQASEVNKSNKGIATTGMRPLGHPRSRINPPPVERQRERSKPIPQSPGTAADVMLPSEKSSRSVSQPTLSQLSRAHATERKRLAITVRPQWGRPNAKSLMKSIANPRAAGKISKTQSESRPITPCQVPLPPSPPRTGTPRSFPSGYTTPLSICIPSPAVFSAGPEDTLRTEIPPEVERSDKASVQVATAIRKDAKLSSSDAGDSCKCTHPPEPSSNDQELDFSSIHETPRPLFPSEDHPDDMSSTKTPISALLTSIQRGFLLTPSSPLSPPQSYIYRDSVPSKDIGTYVLSHADHPEQTKLPPRKPFMFGLAAEDIGRHALNNVKNLDVRW